MEYYDKLTKKRKLFIEQLYNLINSQFEEQGKLKGETKQIMKELEDNSDYIQRIFVDAPWGMGKTYFSKALKELIDQKNQDKIDKKINFIEINSWKTDYFSDPMKSLIGELSISKAINPTVEEMANKLLMNIFKLLGKGLILKYFNITKEDIDSIAEGVSKTVISDYKEYSDLVKDFKENLSKDETLKLILIDELDRCRPEYAIELLETVKHFFGVKNVIFIFLVNMEQMKSIISTSYLTEDKCSEYFEKFYDIKFKLPDIDYNDFMEIEYSKYLEMNAFDYYVRDGLFCTDDITKCYEELFLEMFKSNILNVEVSPRFFIKSFKKFKLLFSSLSLEEKNNYALMIVLMLYFIKKEFFRKNDIPLGMLYLKTFFNSKENDILKINERNIYDKVEIREKYRSTIENFYFKFLLILIFEKGRKISTNSSDFFYYRYCIRFSQLEVENHGQLVKKKSKEKEIVLKNINFYQSDYDIFFDISLLDDEMKQYKINYQGQTNIYELKALEIWCENKYNFILN